MPTTTIRDYALATGGGHAVVHVAGCDALRRTAMEVEASGPVDVWVSDEVVFERYPMGVATVDPRVVAATYAGRFAVGFPVRLCACADVVVAELDARRVAERASES